MKIIKPKDIQILSSKKGFGVKPFMITSILLTMIMLTILFNIMGSSVPTAAVSFHNMTDDLAAETDALGTDAAAFAGTSDDQLGWIWAAGPLILAIVILVKVFFPGNGRRRRRRY